MDRLSRPLTASPGWHSRRWWVLLLIVGWSSGLGRPVTGQDLASHLTSAGIEFTPGVSIKLPRPSLSPEVAQADRLAAAQALAGSAAWERFIGDSLNAPVTVDIAPIVGPQAERLGLSVHTAFVVHTTLERLSDRQAMEAVFGKPQEGSQMDGLVIQELSADQLQSHGMEQMSDGSTQFFYIELPLLNKVLVQGVARVEAQQREDGVEYYWQLDPRFNDQPQWATRWTRLERNAVGKLVHGETFAYAGCGGFWGAYQIGPEASPLVIESQLLLREPQQWFAGSHFLRSKIPSLMQENARTFRRKLASQ